MGSGNSQQIEEAAAAWLARRDSGDWSDAEQAAFGLWVEQSTAHRVAFVRLESAWHQAQRLKALAAGATPGTVPPLGEWRQSPFFERQVANGSTDATDETAAANFSVDAGPARSSTTDIKPVDVPISRSTNLIPLGTLAEVKHGSSRAWSRAIAASFLLTIALASGWYLWPHGPIYRTDVGGLASVPLPDGSKVTLNTASEIRVALTETVRRVSLDRGEAFFEVAKDSTRPFVVTVGNKRVIAVGTKFSVRRSGDDIRVAVTEGKVRVESDSVSPLRSPVPMRGTEQDGSGEVFLTSGAVASAGDDGIVILERPLAAMEDDLSWRRGYLTFHDSSLANVVAEFNRYNRHKMTIDDPDLAAIRISGTFRAVNYEAFVRILVNGFSIHATSTEDTTTLEK